MGRIEEGRKRQQRERKKVQGLSLFLTMLPVVACESWVNAVAAVRPDATLAPPSLAPWPAAPLPAAPFTAGSLPLPLLLLLLLLLPLLRCSSSSLAASRVSAALGLAGSWRRCSGGGWTSLARWGGKSRATWPWVMG